MSSKKLPWPKEWLSDKKHMKLFQIEALIPMDEDDVCDYQHNLQYALDTINEIGAARVVDAFDLSVDCEDEAYIHLDEREKKGWRLRTK